jgi:hypothetical protein
MDDNRRMTEEGKECGTGCWILDFGFWIADRRRQALLAAEADFALCASLRTIHNPKSKIQNPEWPCGFS